MTLLVVLAMAVFAIALRGWGEAVARAAGRRIQNVRRISIYSRACDFTLNSVRS